MKLAWERKYMRFHKCIHTLHLSMHHGNEEKCRTHPKITTMSLSFFPA